MNGVIGIECVDMLKQISLGDGLRKNFYTRLHAHFGSGLLFLGYIGDGSWIFSDANECYMGNDRRQPGHSRFDFRENLLGD